jgi:hypothetical protein
VLDPEILLFDEPDSGLDPVRVAYLDQLVVDINAQTGATCLIVTHNIGTARSVPDNIGLLYQKHLAMFGPRHQLLTSSEPVVRQFMNGRKQGPIGMSEEKDTGEQEKEKEEGGPEAELPPIEPQLLPTWPLVRRSMASPHGSHAFLKEPGMREKIKVNAKFGEDGLEPSEEAPSKSMSPEDFLEYLGMDPKTQKGSPDSDEDAAGQDGGDQKDSGDRDSGGDGGSQTEDGRGSTRPIPVPTGDHDRTAVGPKAGAAAAATAATAAVAMHKTRHRDGADVDEHTRPMPATDDRPRPTPDGRPRPTPQPTGANREGMSQPTPEPVGASAPTAALPRTDGNAQAPANGNTRREPAGSRRGMLASLLRRGDR